ncbi:MAG: hypothetical protein AAFU67_16360, partial [Bacteroidota bacterium]
FASPEKIVVFDFEMVCYCWYMHDVATVLYYAANHPGSGQYEQFESVFMDNFWMGYEQHHRLPRGDRSMISPYLLYRDIMVYGYLGKVWGGNENTSQHEVVLNRFRANIDRRKNELFP